MEKFIIQGGKPLKGVVQLGGAKNAGFKLMITALLMKGESVLLNITPIGDVRIAKEIISLLGGHVTLHGDKNYFVQADSISSFMIPEKYGEKSRASLLFAGPLLHKFKKAVIPFPGGDRIGSSRDLDRHFDGIKAFNVDVHLEGNSIHLSTTELTACNYRFKKPSHTATETLLMLAVVAKGKTILENCALEPEVDDMIAFLNKAGAKIKRLPDKVIEIEGVTELLGRVHKVISDRNQAVTYALAAIMTKGDIIIEDIHHSQLSAFLEKLKEANGGYETGEFGVRFFYKGPIKAVDVTTGPHPDFMTDWMPLWAVFMTQAEGTSHIVERIYDNRFQFVDILNSIGSDISYYDPQPANPDDFYYFNLKTDQKYDKQGITIKGKSELSNLNAAVWDIRFGATLLLAALVSQGKSELQEIFHIDRGYDQIDKKLSLLGAEIERVA
ncbi:MAG: UDP-N-acetylglucosamine 1-carboxyvinyltransferase [Patescibacteria group bacterium]